MPTRSNAGPANSHLNPSSPSAPPSRPPPHQTDSERYSFIVEYLDTHAGLTFRYQLLFWAADSSVEMYDIKNRRSFLKKTRVPSITTKDFFLGATITVYSRQLKVVEYGDAHTERAFASARQRVFALVKPNAIRSAGKIIHAAVASGFVVAECKMATMQRADAERMFGDRNDRALVNDACAGACVGIALVSEDAVAKFAALNGEKARSYLHRSPYDRVGVVNADP